MSLHLVTGYKGNAHITSADQGAFNAGIVGTGEYVLATGKQFEAQVISNNQIRIYDGDILMQGRHITLKKDTYEDVVIANGLQGMNRNDLIVVRYTKDSTTGVENTQFVVVQGVSTDGTASDPAYAIGDVLSGECLLNEMPLYRVPLTGLNVGELVPLFETANSIGDMASLAEQVAKNDSAIKKNAGDIAKLSYFLTGTLTAGETTLTISNSSITEDSMIDIYTNVFGVNPTEVTVASGSITLVFDALESDLGVKVRVM